MGGGTTIERKWGDFLMADYVVTDTDLTAVASVIRTKGGTSAGLAFPSGFISAIGNITSGDWVDISTNVILGVSGNSSLIFAIYSLSLNIVAIYVHLDIPDPWEAGGLTVAYGQYQPPTSGGASLVRGIGFSSTDTSVTPKLSSGYNEPDGVHYRFADFPYNSGYTDYLLVYTLASS